jgi:hypothetical protein
LRPGESAAVAFTTLVAPTRERAFELADRYHTPPASQRALDLAWTETQVELRELNISPGDATIFQELAGHLLYSSEDLGPHETDRAGSHGAQPLLWSIGVSGDRPILLARIDSPEGLPTLRQIFSAHHYWRRRGLHVDLLVLNEQAATYQHELDDRITATLAASTDAGVIDQPGGVFLRRSDNIAEDDRVEIRLEDHYWDNTDAAVVFERRDRASGERRYVYHGNDGTSFPWNDTAQLDFSRADVREQVIRTIVDVARRFPVIRFDAAMVLARKHVRRLWFPAPGTGGAIPSRAEHGMTHEEFDARMPEEFWREVVDRVAAEVPDTLLLAEAFWLLEGYFVRTLGMHRVYNSAFMHMLRDEDNAGYRRVLKDTLEFDPDILKRYVNFMNNPDEKTAIEQFGKGDKYFGVATLLATLPGLPMLGHGQFEGFGEVRHGVPAGDADEPVDEWLVGRHEHEIVPLLHRRGDFAEARDFLLYDLAHDLGGVDENVFAYSNGTGAARSLVVYHNRYGESSGWIRDSVAYAVKADDGSKRQARRTLAEGLGLADGPADDRWLALREQRSGLEYLRSVAEIRERGLHVALRAYETRVYWELRELHDAAGLWRRLAERLGGRGVPSLEGALRELQLAPVHDALRAVMADPSRPSVERLVAAVADTTGTAGDQAAVVDLVAERAERAAPVIASIDDPSQEAAMRLWTGGAAGIAATGREPRGDEPGVVRGAAAGAGRGRGAAGAGRGRGGRLVGRRACPDAAGAGAAVRGRRARLGPGGAPGGRVAGGSLGAGVPAGLPMGRHRLVPPGVVPGAGRLDGPPGAGADADPGACPSAPRAVRGRAPAGRGGRRVGLPGRPVARGAGGRCGGDGVASSTLPRSPGSEGHGPSARSRRTKKRPRRPPPAD